MEKCLGCDLIFETHIQMKAHYKDKHSKDYNCKLCPKSFQNLEDTLHHIILEHRGITKEQLKRGVAAEQTKKQLGDSILNGEAGVNYDCPECFEFFPSIDKLEEHRIKNHNSQLTNPAKEKLKELFELSQSKDPQCEICKKRYLGLVVCKMESKSVGACMNCYENYYGPNALHQITIGTPNELLKKMRIPTG